MIDNYIIYDWITFTSKIHNHLSIIDFLGLQDLQFESRKGMHFYRDRLYFGGISINYNGLEDKDMGVCVEMSGQGCRTWEKYGNSDYDKLFSEILENYSDDPEKRDMNITRIDVAYDDFNNILDLPLLCIETQLQHYVSRFKDWNSSIGNKGISVTHGSNKSNVYIRIYDKRLEQKVDKKIPHWIRCELQIRHECALGFIKLKDSIEKNYFTTLNYYLRYIVPTNNTTNSSMLDTAPYWLKFIESAESKSIFCKPADTYSFNKLHGYVNNQLSGAISTYIDVVGVDQFLLDINNSIKGKKLNPKYQDILKANDCDQHGANILKYIEEHGKNETI